jgi:periplasmic protein TonB
MCAGAGVWPGFAMQAPLLELRRSDTEDASPVRAPPAWAQLGNVVPFARPHARRSEPELPPLAEVVPAEPFAAAVPGDGAQRRLAALLVASLAIHAALLALLWPAPPPLVGIELAPLTVEIVVSDGSRGTSSPNVSEQTPGEAPKKLELAQPTPETVRPADTPVEDKAAAVSEPAREPPAPDAIPPEAEQPAVKSTAENAPVEKAPPASEPEQTQPPANSEQLRQTEAALQPEPIVPPPPVHTKQVPPETKAAPVPPPKPTPAQSTAAPVRKQESAREAKRPAQAVPNHPAQNGIKDKAAAAKASASAPARQSSADPNYRGQVFAHLARFKRMPPEAQRNHSQGVATVSFVIDGSGHVGAVSLVGATGIASLDQEAQSLPRRASPFPPPPGGRPVPVRAPISFRF